LKIKNLKKTYENGYEGVKGVNLRMFTGQIFALLGHNGAGKTTTVSMLTGLIESTEGSAEIFGIDLFDKMDEVREFLGVFPQHNILFDLLTPQEHLEIFCDFKGVESNTKKDEISKMLTEISLQDHKNSIVQNLSEGSKR
jgi:ATP-binding cassette subfamily A (ABC1) protein 3